jgi:hypothetical protein
MSRNITSLPIRVTAAGAGCEEDDAMPKGMLASEKWWAYESSAILLFPIFIFNDSRVVCLADGQRKYSIGHKNIFCG